MSSVAPKEEWDKEVLVIEKVNGEERRRKMTLRQAYSQIDFSKQWSFCKNCGHSIDEHEAIKEFKTKFAGKCLHKSIPKCHCEQYRPGPVVTTKEMQQATMDKSDMPPS